MKNKESTKTYTKERKQHNVQQNNQQQPQQQHQAQKKDRLEIQQYKLSELFKIPELGVGEGKCM